MDRIQIIYEMANNHMGDIDHGLKIIEEFSVLSKSFDMDFSFKFQFRDLDTFIHPNYKGADLKFIKLVYSDERQLLVRIRANNRLK